MESMSSYAGSPEQIRLRHRHRSQDASHTDEQPEYTTRELKAIVKESVKVLEKHLYDRVEEMNCMRARIEQLKAKNWKQGGEIRRLTEKCEAMKGAVSIAEGTNRQNEPITVKIHAFSRVIVSGARELHLEQTRIRTLDDIYCECWSIANRVVYDDPQAELHIDAEIVVSQHDREARRTVSICKSVGTMPSKTIQYFVKLVQMNINWASNELMDVGDITDP